MKNPLTKMKRSRLPLEFKFEGFSALTFHPPFLMPCPHSHNEIEMNYLTEGKMTYLFGGQVTTVKPDHIIVFWGNMPHQVIDRDESARLVIMNVPLPWFLQWRLPENFAYEIVHGRMIVESNRQENRLDQQMFERWLTDLRKNTPGHKKIVLLEVEARLRRMAMNWEERDPGVKRIERDGVFPGEGTFEKIEKITMFIAQHFQEQVRVEDMAKVVDLHPNYLMNLFQKSCGMSLIEYLTRYRVAHAQRLLATSDSKVLDVAMQSGFGSASRFYAAFQKVCGHSPKEYRASLSFAALEPGLQPL